MNPIAAVLLLVLLAPGPAGAQKPAKGVRLSLPSFIFARWASRSSSSIYVGYTLGSLGGFVGLVENPHSGYRELLGGLVTRAVLGRQAVTLGVAYAEASESRYLQTYVVPSLLVAGASVSGTIELYTPLEEAGSHQLDLNPLAVILRPTREIGIGAAYAAGMGEGERPRHRVGPVVEIGIPHGSLKTELLRNMTLTYYEVRLSLQAAF